MAGRPLGAPRSWWRRRRGGTGTRDAVAFAQLLDPVLSADLDQVPRLAVEAMLGLGYDAAAFALVDPVSGSVEQSEARGFPEGFADALGQQALLETAFRLRTTVEFREHSVPGALAAVGLRSVVVIPVDAGVSVACALVGARGGCGHDPRSLAGTLAACVGAALQRSPRAKPAPAGERHRTPLSRIDRLTGVGNRETADEMVAALSPGDAVVRVVLDHIPRITAVHGHEPGEDTVARLGGFLRQRLRADDGIARSEEQQFLLVLRNVGDAAPEVVDRLLDAWRRTAPRTTVSAGLAVHTALRRPGATAALAEIALHRAVRSGRDRSEEFRSPWPDGSGLDDLDPPATGLDG